MSHLRCAAVATVVAVPQFCPKAVSIKCIVFCSTLTHIRSYTMSLSSCTDLNKSFKGAENMVSKIKCLLTCSVGVGSEQMLEPGSPSGYNS